MRSWRVGSRTEILTYNTGILRGRLIHCVKTPTYTNFLMKKKKIVYVFQKSMGGIKVTFESYFFHIFSGICMFPESLNTDKIVFLFQNNWIGGEICFTLDILHHPFYFLFLLLSDCMATKGLGIPARLFSALGVCELFSIQSQPCCCWGSEQFPLPVLDSESCFPSLNDTFTQTLLLSSSHICPHQAGIHMSAWAVHLCSMKGESWGENHSSCRSPHCW